MDVVWHLLMTRCSCYIVDCHKQFIRKETGWWWVSGVKPVQGNVVVRKEDAHHRFLLPLWVHNIETAPSCDLWRYRLRQRDSLTATMNGLLQPFHHLYCDSLLMLRGGEEGVYPKPWNAASSRIQRLLPKTKQICTNWSFAFIKPGDCEPLCSCCPAGCLNHTWR